MLPCDLLLSCLCLLKSLQLWEVVKQLGTQCQSHGPTEGISYSEQERSQHMRPLWNEISKDYARVTITQSHQLLFGAFVLDRKGGSMETDEYIRLHLSWFGSQSGWQSGTGLLGREKNRTWLDFCSYPTGWHFASVYKSPKLLCGSRPNPAFLLIRQKHLTWVEKEVK